VIESFRSALSRLARDDRGQSIVEYALGLSISMYLIMGVVDFGRAFYAYNVIANTAREGARYGAVSGRTNSQIIAWATGRAYLSNLTVTVVDPGTSGDTAWTDPVVVQVSHTFTPITPLIAQICCGGGSLTLTARSSMHVEW
jgi:hypothetical protein